MNDVLLVYYSFEGNTSYVADLIQAHCPDVTAERLIAENEPPKKGLGKFFLGGKSALLQSDPHLKPVRSKPEDFAKIILAFPVWAGTYPPAIGAYLKSVEIKNKEIYVIACSASGNAEKAIAKTKAALPDNTHKGSLSLLNPLKNKETVEKQVADFLNEQGIHG